MTVAKRTPSSARTLLEKFKEYHLRNPHVFRALLVIAQEVKNSGVDRVGIEFVVHRLRWLTDIEGVDTNTVYAFDERYKTFYARLLMMYDPALEGLFRTKMTSAWSGQRVDLQDVLPEAA
jgi:hypothetical protein